VLDAAVAVAEDELLFADDLLADGGMEVLEVVGVKDTAKIGTVGVKAWFACPA